MEGKEKRTNEITIEDLSCSIYLEFEEKEYVSREVLELRIYLWCEVHLKDSHIQVLWKVA